MKRFALSDVKRCPVTLTEKAKKFINASHAQGRLLPQALQEHFGKLAHVQNVHVDLGNMKDYHPFHEDENAHALLVFVRYMYNGSNKEHCFHLNAEGHLRGHHETTKLPTVQARHIGMELCRLHLYRLNRFG